MKKTWKFIRNILLIVVLIIAVFVVYVTVSAYPTSIYIRRLFDGGVAVKPENYTEIFNRVDVEENLVYPSKNKDNTYDLFMPKNRTGNEPIILWVHGGAFVGGDKDDIDEYAVQIADQGYIVVSMNYRRAPEGKYPTPVLQLGELYEHIQSERVARNFTSDKLILAGDSAGAHIAAQFAMVQNDEAYATRTGITPVMPPNTINAIGLFCGPYDLEHLVSEASESVVFDFIMNRIAWGYLGDKGWKTSGVVDDLSLLNHVNESFPAAFITDGNEGSFMKDGVALTDKLRGYGVTVKDVFYEKDVEVLNHEYQFKMDSPSSQNTFNQFITFLNDVTK